MLSRAARRAAARWAPRPLAPSPAASRRLRGALPGPAAAARPAYCACPLRAVCIHVRAAAAAVGGPAETAQARGLGAWAADRLRALLTSTNVRRALLASRAFVLVGSLYSLGFAAGMNAYAQDPEGTRKRQVEQVLRGLGAITDEGDFKVVPRDSEETHAVRQVLPHIMQAARDEVRHLQAEVQEKLSVTDSADLREEASNLELVRAQVDHWRDDGFLLVDLNSPNAFVHALVPRLIFVHRGLFNRHKLVPLDSDASRGSRVAVWCDAAWLTGECVRMDGSQMIVLMDTGEELEKHVDHVRKVETMHIINKPEQLAILLGHEVAHVIHNHAEESNSLRACAIGCQLVVLAILDPTGLFTFVADVGMAIISRYGLQLPQSRANEFEADATGLRICARAGFDPRVAPEFFDRMLEAEEAHEGRTHATWTSTHPRTEDRAKALRAAAEDAMALYECALAKKAAEEVASYSAAQQAASHRMPGILRVVRGVR